MESYYVSLTDIGKSEVVKEDIETSDLKDDEALIKAHYSMISAGTELSRAFALKKGFKYPVRPGYCMVGEVLEAGKNMNVKKGDRVFVNAPHSSLVKWTHVEDTQSSKVIKLPDGIDLIDATAINLFLVAIQGVNLTEVKLGHTVGVFGLGNIGIIAALMYQKMGCRVIGLDPVSSRCQLAEKMGLKNVCDSSNQIEAVNLFTNNEGLDIAVDATGLSPVIISCITNTRAYGQLLLLGSPRVGYECDITPVLNAMHMKNLKIIGGFNKTTPYYPQEGSNNCFIRNFEVVCELIKNKDIDVSKMITKVIDPKDCQQAYYDLMYNKKDVNAIVYDWTKY